MTIRQMDLSDSSTVEELWALQHAAYRQEAALIGAADLPPLLDTLEKIRHSEEAYYGYFMEDQELAGAVSMLSAAGECTLCRLMVAPAFLRRGIASALLQHLIDGLFPGSAWVVNAEVRNVPAIRLYERNGFHIANYWQPSPRLTMARMVRPGFADADT